MAENFTAKSFVTNSFATWQFQVARQFCGRQFHREQFNLAPLLEIDFFDVSDDFEQEKITFFGTKNLLKL